MIVLTRFIKLFFQDSTLYCKNLVIPDCVDRTIYCTTPPDQLSQGAVTVNFNPSPYYRKTNGKFWTKLKKSVINYKASQLHSFDVQTWSRSYQTFFLR